MRTIACIVGARPNFVKMGPILSAFGRYRQELNPVLVHTGQHYDAAMSGLFFSQLGLPEPAAHLAVGSGSQGEQTANVLSKYEAWLTKVEPRPAATLVVGDVNSTMACALASVKLGIPVIHVEAGLRSFDRRMPEEINRVVTDSIADLLMVSEPSGVDNLLAEGRPKSCIRLVGNVMIDVLMSQLPSATALNHAKVLGVPVKEFALWTMHRPSNVDDEKMLVRLVKAMIQISKRLPVVFPAHPRTRGRLQKAGLWGELEASGKIILTEPLGYLECLSLSSTARLIVTDSGGIQEESTVLGVPCLTLRENTERPITVTEGTSTLVGSNIPLLKRLVNDVVEGKYKRGRAPKLWDGHAADRIADGVAALVLGSSKKAAKKPVAATRKRRTAVLASR